jgi:thymidylate synthase (FAD)
MKIIKPSAELLWMTPDAEKMIELAGRTCYKSEDKITDESAKVFVDKICNVVKHHSVIEHACASFKFVTDRGVTHELVRHRLAAYSQESTRYCNYSKDKFNKEISVIEPPGLSEQQRIIWELTCQNCERWYNELISGGCKPQIARSILPTCLKTEIVVTTNFREWKHIFNLRCAENAHPQIREIMLMAKQIMEEKVPSVFK